MFFSKCMWMTCAAAAGAWAALGDSAVLPQSFEDVAVDAAVTTLTGWDGYGTIVETGQDQTLKVGSPIATTHTRHLSVNGWVEAAFDTTGDVNDRELEMLVKVALPDDELAEMTDTEAKFALAIDKTDTEGKGVLKYWKSTGDTGEWAPVNDDVYTEGQWIRVLVIFNAANGGRCKVVVDGSVATKGTAADGTGTGPYFPVLKPTTTLASMKIVGTTAIDDVTLAKTAVADYTPSYVGAQGEITQAGSQVTLAWLDANDLPANTTVTAVAADASGLTYEQKFILGNKAADGKKFELQSITMSKENAEVKVTIQAPVFGTPAAGYTAKIQTSTDGAAWSDGPAVTSGANVVLTLPAGEVKVTKFRVIVAKVSQ